MDLDALLDDAADTLLTAPKPVVAPKPVTAPAVPAEIKPWLASSANVPKEIREKWSRYVKLDRNAQIQSKLQPSNSYRSWDSQPINTSKLLGDLVRKAASAHSFDEVKTSKLLSVYQPVTDTEFSKNIQTAFAEKILSSMKEAVLSDPNYSPEKFPNLAAALSK